MKIKLTKIDINVILECMGWNKYHFQQQRKEDCLDKEGTLKEMDRVIIKLKEMQ